jgi:hypothetical protein
MEAEVFSLKRIDVKNESFPFGRKDFRLYYNKILDKNSKQRDFQQGKRIAKSTIYKSKK